MISLKQKFHTRSFPELVPVFEGWLKKWQPLKNNLPIAEILGPNIGVRGALKIINERHSSELDDDFSGAYIFLKDGLPFYVGISKKVLNRIKQHIKGKDHFKSSLCYRMGAKEFFRIHGVKHTGGRAGLDFLKYGAPFREKLAKCNVAFFIVESSLELYLFEVFVAMKLGTLKYNKFKTH